MWTPTASTAMATAKAAPVEPASPDRRSGRNGRRRGADRGIHKQLVWQDVLRLGPLNTRSTDNSSAAQANGGHAPTADAEGAGVI